MGIMTDFSDELRVEVDRLRKREQQLLERNNADLDRRRKAEAEVYAINIAIQHLISGHATDVSGLKYALASAERANEELRAKVERLEVEVARLMLGTGTSIESSS